MKCRFSLYVVVACSIMALSGCGGNSNTRDGGSTYLSGGTEYAPAPLDLTQGHKIVENAFYNYFSYDALAGEELRFESILTKGITDFQRQECEENMETFIVVYDASMNPLDAYKSCSSSMSVQFTLDGKYIFQLKYPGNYGHFNISSDKE